jgi:hypothetical protein
VPEKIDPKVKERCVQQMLEHVSEYPNPTAAAEGSPTVTAWGPSRSAAGICKRRSTAASAGAPPVRSWRRSAI